METQHHYLSCLAPTWVKILTDAQQNLSRRLHQIGTSPTIISIILKAITNNFSTEEIQWPLPISESDVIAYEAAHSQQLISWEHILQGRLSMFWLKAQRTYFREQPNSHSQFVGLMETWKTAFLPSLLQYGLDLWEKRNEHVHGRTPKEAKYILRKKVLQQVHQKYKEGSSTVAPPQARLFQKPEVLRCRQTTRSLQHWLYSIETAQTARKLQLEKLRSSFRPLKDYGFSCPTVISTESVNSKQLKSKRHKSAKSTSGYQKKLREYFLLSAPSVRYRE